MRGGVLAEVGVGFGAVVGVSLGTGVVVRESSRSSTGQTGSSGSWVAFGSSEVAGGLGTFVASRGRGKWTGYVVGSLSVAAVRGGRWGMSHWTFLTLCRVTESVSLWYTMATRSNVDV